MGNVKFIGCLHLGHEWMAKHRGFIDVEDYHKTLIKNWNDHVNKKDLIYILGDITMETPEYYPILDKLKGRKRVILGNHDRAKDVPELLKYVESVSGYERYKNYMLSHIPIHPCEVAYMKGNIHAHIHENTLEDIEINEYYNSDKIISTINKYFNVDAKKLYYIPMEFNKLTNIIDE